LTICQLKCNEELPKSKKKRTNIVGEPHGDRKIQIGCMVDFDLQDRIASDNDP
jgi:hypothetical protein